MISTKAVTLIITQGNILSKVLAILFVCQSSLQLVKATYNQSETETSSSASVDKLSELLIQYSNKKPSHKDGEKEDNFTKRRKWNYLYENSVDRTHRYFNSQLRYYTIKPIGLQNGTFTDVWKGYCPELEPWLIKPFNISTPITGSREEIFKFVLRKRKERTKSNNCVKNGCCIFSNVASRELLFVKDYLSFNLDSLCCKMSVLHLDNQMINEFTGYDFDVRDFDKFESEMKLGHIRLNIFNALEKNESAFNNSKEFILRNRRDLSIFNSSRDFNSSFHQISIQNNIDASWGMVSIFIVVMFVIVIGCYLKMFNIKQKTKVHFQYHDGIHLMYVNDLVRRKARLLPMFQSAFRQHDEEILFQRGRKDHHVPLASLVEEDEGDQAENYNDDEQYLD
ncbi:uncharacterized protein LOC132544160 [Ylistrum balloti]|uniref:uncharacterized protein LOC132544160 n=1 Tax=Ylistrum balloti TaxID=509963 RepID=UPI002905E81F|nr:uncharacterized protein LOC132544160 [Ylistrum balloti]